MSCRILLVLPHLCPLAHKALSCRILFSVGENVHLSLMPQYSQQLFAATLLQSMWPFITFHLSGLQRAESYSRACAFAVNRRLDEWVPLSRFESLEKYCIDTYHNGLHSAAGLDLVNSGDRKITRNQKRKHDAINHVQTVLCMHHSCRQKLLALNCFLNTILL